MCKNLHQWKFLRPTSSSDAFQTGLRYKRLKSVHHPLEKWELLFSSVGLLNISHGHRVFFLKLNAPYIGTKEVPGYIWICKRQISPKIPLSTCFFSSMQLEGMDLVALQQCIIFGCNVFEKDYSELLNHSNFSKLICKKYYY